MGYIIKNGIIYGGNSDSEDFVTKEELTQEIVGLWQDCFQPRGSANDINIDELRGTLQGVYWVEATKTLGTQPWTDKYYMLIVQGNLQTAFRVSTTKNIMLTRMYYNGAWGEWNEGNISSNTGASEWTKITNTNNYTIPLPSSYNELHVVVYTSVYYRSTVTLLKSDISSSTYYFRYGYYNGASDNMGFTLKTTNTQLVLENIMVNGTSVTTGHKIEAWYR